MSKNLFVKIEVGNVEVGDVIPKIAEHFLFTLGLPFRKGIVVIVLEFKVIFLWLSLFFGEITIISLFIVYFSIEIVGIAFLVGGNKDGKEPQQLWPLYFDKYIDHSQPPISEEEIEDLQAEMEALNRQGI